MGRTLAVVALLLGLTAAGPAPAPSDATVRRLAGDDRVATAVALSVDGHERASLVVLATSQSFPDALSGAVLAAARDAPLLLTPPTGLAPVVLDELERLGASEAIVLGGPAALPEDVAAQVRDLGLDVRRIGGASRYETSAMIAEEVGVDGTVLLATGRGFADAVSASAYAADRGWPVLLVDGDAVPAPTLRVLEDAGTRRAVPVGGPDAIDESVLDTVRDAGVDVAGRLAGPTRWATSAAVVDAHLGTSPGTEAIWVATGADFPDALAAGAAAARAGAVLQTTPPHTADVDGSAEDVAGTVTEHAACRGGSLTTAVVVGGPLALSDQVRDELAALLTCEQPPPPPPDPDPDPDPDPPPPFSLLAAGDIADCGSDGDEATADQLDALEGAIAALGDLAYDSGTAEEFAECYDPSWGRHRDRTHPVPGNHDVDTDDGAPYYDYFGARAGPPLKGWYARQLTDDWRLVALNSNCAEAGGCDAGSEQHDWLLAELQAHPGDHVVAMMHHPRWSSGRNGSIDEVHPLVAALADAGADLMLAGHDHNYERFAPVDASGEADSDGIVQFVAGTGGKSLRAVGDPIPNSRAVIEDHYGVLRLTLLPDGYTWEFLPVEPGGPTDTGRRDLP